MGGPLSDRPSGQALTVAELCDLLADVPDRATVHLLVDFPLPPLDADDPIDVDLLAPIHDVHHRTDQTVGHFVELTIGFPG